MSVCPDCGDEHLTLNFGQALELLKKGESVSRPSLVRGQGIILGLDGHIQALRMDGYVSPWFPTHDDLLAEDWLQVVVMEEKEPETRVEVVDETEIKDLFREGVGGTKH